MNLRKYFYDVCNDYKNCTTFVSTQDYIAEWYKLSDKKGLINIFPHANYNHFITHSHDFFEFVYVYNGSCKITVDNSNITLESKDICLFNLQAKHSIQVMNTEEDIIFYILVHPDYFKSAYFQLIYLPNDKYIFDFFLESMLNHYIKDNFILIHHLQDSTYNNLIEHIIYENYENRNHKEEMINFLLSSLLIEFSRSYETHINNSSKIELDKYKISEITDYIYENYKNVTLKSLAKHFNYSSTYLSTIIKKYSGNSFSEILHSFRFLKSCQLLTESKDSITDIIEEVGYSNKTWFIQNFRKRYGVSPSEYRKKYKKLPK
ncbi:AraC family transcriptional regulator [Clostridium sp. SHJSY1]|uniref:AraC family transcriptional regulator n=1 Tax=Clostridium sp. SHJSY1 TaxID=2942483 RepID=UPI002873FEC0|nr:AraC family transcriptional regulator [Clostridium sp. SHJSY1]MDS0527426.1 AraC family transcriptional regulator [Clostridium sp. SHJSY1]